MALHRAKMTCIFQEVYRTLSGMLAEKNDVQSLSPTLLYEQAFAWPEVKAATASCSYVLGAESRFTFVDLLSKCAARDVNRGWAPALLCAGLNTRLGIEDRS